MISVSNLGVKLFINVLFMGRRNELFQANCTDTDPHCCKGNKCGKEKA